MSKVAFIDLDGVVANSEKRFELASLDGKINWNKALNGDYVQFDTLIEWVPEHLLLLESRGYRVIYLTSRPEHMRKGTEEWLSRYGLMKPAKRPLEMKPLSEQYTKTVKWKVDRLQELASDKNADEVLLVDDEPAICSELVNRAEDVAYKIIVCSSLAQACE